MALHDVVFLLDVDNTLLDNDQVAADLRDYLTRAFGAQRQERYWAIFEELRRELGYADYLGALQRYPARHYVLVDDKVRILAAVKAIWGKRVTTVFPRQGHYALDPAEVAKYPPADVTVERIGDLLHVDGAALVPTHAV
jgi:hypothetical protein